MSIGIVPSILSADFTRLGEQVRDAEAAGCARIQVDVMDGHFVPNITMGPLVVEAVRRSCAVPIEAHLMITQPERYVADFAQAGADVIIVHLEAAPHLHRLLQQIKGLGKQAGVALNPATPAILLDEVWDLLDLVLVMTVNPGFGGQAFIPATLPKLAAACAAWSTSAAWLATSKWMAASARRPSAWSPRLAPISPSRGRRCSTRRVRSKKT